MSTGDRALALPDGGQRAATSMSAASTIPIPRITGSARGLKDRDLHLSWVLLPISIGLWAFGVARTDVTHLGLLGLVTALPVVFYTGLGLVIISASVELGRRRPSNSALAAHAVALVVMLYGTAPLLYTEPRYSWLYKHIGIAQYVNAHGALSPSIDIYQNWPGFFALAAWFNKVAGVSSALAYAKWAQLVFELAIIPLLYLAYSALALPPRQRWVAILLYSASNWIAQDYFAPQALGSLLSVGIMAIALRWIFVGNSVRRKREDHDRPQSDSVPRWRRWSRIPARRAWLPFFGLLVLIYFVLTFTHELSPYIILIQLAALAVFGYVRPRWLPLVLAAIAVGYLLPRFGFINRNFGILATIGNFFGNIAPPSVGQLPVPAAEKLIQHGTELLSLGIWALAVAGAWVRRRSGRTVRALVVLMVSPVAVLLAGGYANEGILRVYLFSLPWAAALAAAAISPFAATTTATRRERSVESAARDRRIRLPRLAWRVPIAVGAAAALFIPSFFGNDAENVMPVSEVNTITSFMETAKPGLLYLPDYDTPGWNTAGYQNWYFALIFGPRNVWPSAHVNMTVAAVIARTALAANKGIAPAYVIITPSMAAYNESNPVTESGGIAVLQRSLARSGYWQLITDSGGTVIYELPPGATVPTGRATGVNYSVP